MIYTSRYANPVLRSGKYTVVAISKSIPKWELGYEIAGHLIGLSPAGYLLKETDRVKFRNCYLYQLERTGISSVKKMLEYFISLGKDVVLCCYEDIRNPEMFCHRTNLAEWLTERTGIVIEELEDTSNNKWAVVEQPKKEAEKPSEPEYTQLSLW